VNVGLGERLAAGRLRIAHEWPFRFAHHPLCERFGSDVLRIGRLHVCRSCTALWSGFVAGGLATALAPAPLPAVPLAVAGAAALVPIALASPPRVHGRLPRPVRDLARCASGVLASLALVLALRGALLPGCLLALGLTGVFLALSGSRQRGRGRRCDGCPELDTGFAPESGTGSGPGSGKGVCSGYALAAEQLRAWEEAEVARLAARGFRPKSGAPLGPPT